MGYILTMIVLCALYALGVYCMKYMRNTKIVNLCFTACVFIPYVALCCIVYTDVGFYDWNFQNTLPVANVSPFMFTVIPIFLLLPKRVKKYAYLLVSLLSVGMFLSAIFGCIYNAAIQYKFHPHFVLDYVAHFALSLFGVYMIRSGQVQLNKKNALISASIIFGAAVCMMVCNVIFDTAFFGLSLNGKHNIYNNVLVDNSYLSALLYFAGLAVVLLLGYLYSAFVKSKLGAVETQVKEEIN